jgi:hypothetical protein
MGANSGTATINNATISLPNATSVNIGGASSTLSFSSSTGVKQITTGGTTDLALMPGGNVGIGITNPSQKLEVAGNIYANAGQIRLGNFSSAPSAIGAGSLYYDTTTNQVYYYNGSSWTAISGSGSVAWSALTNPTANLSLSMSSYTTTFTWGSSTGTNNLFNLTDSANNTGTGYLLNIATATGSSLKPLRVAAAGTEAIAVNATGNVGIGTTNPSEKLALAGGNFLHYASGNPTLKGNYDTSGSARAVYISGKHAYVADGASGLQIIDISNLSSPTLTGTYNTPGNALGVSVAGKYAYISDGASGLQVIDISNPTSPSLSGTYDTTGDARGIYVSGKYAYVADGTSGLHIIDVSDPTSPSLSGTYDTADIAQGVYVLGKYAYVADNATGLVIINISNPSSPSLVGTYNTSGAAYSVYVSGKYAYVADGTSGLQIINVSNPASPSLVGTYDTSGTASGVYVSGKYAYVADGSSGIHIIDISNPSSPSLVGTYDTSGTAYGSFVSGKYAYVADGGSGLQIIDINGVETPSLYAGNIQSNDMTITENLDIGNNLYVRNGLNVGPGGLYVDEGEVAFDSDSSSTAFSFRQKGAGNILDVYNGSSIVFTIINGGNVGIGTTSPSTFKLETAGSIGPSVDNTYDLGSSGRRWANIYGTNIYGNITPTGFTQGSVIFAGSGGQLSQNNAQFFWDNTNNRLGIGTTSPAVSIDSTGSLRLRNGTFQIGNAANVAYNRIGTTATNRGLSAANDLLINGKLEVDQALFPDSGIYGSAGTLVVNFPNNDAWFTDEVWIDGKLGIGTTTPANKLSVIGGANIGSATYNVTAPTNGLIVEGNVGIGTTGPSQRLEIAGNTLLNSDTYKSYFGNTDKYVGAGRNNDLSLVNNRTNTWMRIGSTAGISFWGAAGADTDDNPHMRIDTGGNVGIGTISPAGILSIAGQGDTDTGKHNFIQEYASNNAGLKPTWYTSRARGTLASRSAVQDGDSLNMFEITGWSGTGWNAAARFGADVDGTVSTSSVPGRLYFSTTQAGNSSPTIRMVINNAGNVGIGTTGPIAKLEIKGMSGDKAIQIGEYGTNGLSSTNFVGTRYFWDTDNLQIGLRDYGSDRKDAVFNIEQSADNFRFQVAGSDIMFIGGNGNVGIGTTSPGYALDVSGYIRSSQEIISTLGSASSQFRAISGNYGLMLRNDGSATYFLLTNSGNQYGSWNSLRPFIINNANGNVGIGNDTLYIQHGGNVGIGTTSPGINLEVNNNTSGAIVGIRVQGNTSNSWPGVQIRGTRNWAIFVDPYSRLRFSDYDSGGTDRMSIDSSGNVGIGTTNPSEELYITGNGGTYAWVQLALKGTNNGGGLQLINDANQIWEMQSVYSSAANAPSDFIIYDRTAGAYRMVIQDTTGNVGIGLTNPSYQLQLSQNSAAKPTSNTWTIASDARIKDVVRNYEKGLAEILQINPIIYTYKENNALGIVDPGEHIGIIAQAVQPIFPEAITTDDRGYLHFNSDALSWASINAIKELNSKINSLSSQFSDLSLTSTGDLNIQKDQTGNYTVERTVLVGGQSLTETITRLAAFAETVIGKVKAGAITAQEITTNGFIAFQAQVDNLLVTTGLVSPSVQTGIISPLANEKDVIIKLGYQGSGAVPGKLAIQNKEGQEVASIDASGNATFSGTLESKDLLVEDNATISGNLTAENINTNEIRAEKLVVDQIISPSGYQSGVTLEQIEELLRQAKADQDTLNQAQDWYNATSSAQIKNLAAENATLKNLFVTQSIAANSLSLSQSLSLGTDMVIQSSLTDQGIQVNSIDTLSAPLSIQALALAPVEIMAGKIRIETNGDVFIQGNLYVAGKVESSGFTVKGADPELVQIKDESGNITANISSTGSAQFKELTSDKIVIAGASNATDSAQIVNGQINTNATAGAATLPAGKTEITIVSPYIKATNLVYVTPTSDTKNYVLFVKAKEDGRMVVGFNRALDIDVSFNWWVVEAK